MTNVLIVDDEKNRARRSEISAFERRRRKKCF